MTNQYANGNINNIGQMVGDININVAQADNPPAAKADGIISDTQAKHIMAIIKAMVTLDTEQGRADQQALLFHIANKAAGVESYKNIPADQYQNALAALEKHLRTRKLQNSAK